jgi:hypothetical protein
MRRRTDPRPFSEIQDEWYAKIKADGFEDIENHSHPDRPLKEWHSQKFLSQRSRIRQEERERYNEQIQDFLNYHHFDEICKLMVKHGNNTLTPKKVKTIIELHQAGLPQRKIAKKLRRSRWCVRLTLIKAQIWMKLAA